MTLWIGSGLGALLYSLGKLGDKTAIAVYLSKQSGGSFMVITFYLLCVCVAIQTVLSLIWPAGEPERGSRLYWQHPLDSLKVKGWPGTGNYKLLSFLLFATMVVLYCVFR